MNDLAYLIEKSAKLNSEKTAFIFQDKLYSFQEVHELSNAFGWGLERLGLQKCDRVALLLPICAESLICEFALLKGGNVKVKINVDFSIEEIKEILIQTDAKAIIYDGLVRDIKNELKDAFPDLFYIPLKDENADVHYEKFIQENKKENYAVPINQQDLFQIIYFKDDNGNLKNSTYTVYSKKASLHHHFIDELNITPEDAFLHVDSLSHESSNKILPFFIKGGANIFMETFSADLFYEYVERFKVTTTHLAPNMIEQLVQFDLKDIYEFSSLKNIEYSHLDMSVELLKRAVDVFGNIFTKVINYHDQFFSYLILTKYDHLVGLFELPRILHSAGREFTFIRTKIVNHDGAEVETDEDGELLISRNHLFTTKDEEEWFSTGQIAKKDERGYIYITDLATRNMTGGMTVANEIC